MLSTRYQRKRTSEVDKRPCFICYKPTNVVLLNEVPQADFFYTCESHLLDQGFAKPHTPPPAQVKLDKEISDLKKEWDSVKPPLPPKPDTPSAESSAPKSETEAKNESETDSNADPKPEPLPLWYNLDARIHRLRIQHKARIAKQKKTAQLLRSPLPSTPSHLPQ